MAPERLLLVGAGHTHLHLVRHAASLAAAGYDTTLVAPRWFHYSGTASAVATGDLAARRGRIDVVALAASVGVRHLDARIDRVDADARTAHTDTGRRLEYDVVSLDVGSVVGPPSPGHPVEAVLPVKPLDRLGGLLDRLRDPALQGRARVTVVGGGASGIELAAHLATRREVARVVLVESGERVGAGLPDSARRRVERLLRERGVELLTGTPVDEVGTARTRLVDGHAVDHDLAVVATGLVAPPLVRDSGLGGPEGVPVRTTLQHLDRDEVYAAGDCADFVAHPLPRLGVHGVRQGPVLHASLLARADGRPLPDYRPPEHPLSVLDLGGGTGLAVRGRWWWHGRSALLLKRVIDRRWLQRYRV